MPRADLIQPGLPVVIPVITLFSWSYIARIVRGYTLSLREKEFVESARAAGAGTTRISQPRSSRTSRAADRLRDAADPDQHPLRGRALVPRPWRPARPGVVGSDPHDASGYYDVAWWLMLFPGAFLILTTLAFNLLGDGLRDAFDVRSER